VHAKGGDDIEKKTENKTKEKNRGDDRGEKTEERTQKKKNQEQREERLKRGGEREHSSAGACTVTFAFAFGVTR
jgi:hypothetical protein